LALLVGFGNRVITRPGERERKKAKKVFQEAVAQGQTAGLLEQLPEASDVFTTSIGNIPAGAELIVEITYLGELKHDAEVDGVRFTIPTVIAQGMETTLANWPKVLQRQQTEIGIQITVDRRNGRGVLYPTDAISKPPHRCGLWAQTSVAPNLEPQMYRSSATLSLGSAELDTDFVLQIVAKDGKCRRPFWRHTQQYPTSEH